MSDGTRGEDKESLVSSPGATPYGRVTDGTNEVSERKVTRVPVPGAIRERTGRDRITPSSCLTYRARNVVRGPGP